MPSADGRGSLLLPSCLWLLRTPKALLPWTPRSALHTNNGCVWLQSVSKPQPVFHTLCTALCAGNCSHNLGKFQITPQR